MWLAVRERSLDPLRSSEEEPPTSLNQHQSLSGDILPHFDINNHFVALKPEIELYILKCCLWHYAPSKDDNIILQKKNSFNLGKA